MVSYFATKKNFRLLSACGAVCILTYVALFGKLRNFRVINNPERAPVRKRIHADLWKRAPYYNETARKNKMTTFITSLEQMTSFLDKNGWPLIVSVSTGRLGNNVHNLALNLVLQQQFPNASYAISLKIFHTLQGLFAEEVLSLPIISDEFLFNRLPKNITSGSQPDLDRTGDFSSYVLPAVNSVMGKRRVLILEAYGLNVFKGYEQFLLNSLRLRDDVKEKATEFLRRTETSLRRERNATNIVFVGTHVRRMDYFKLVKFLSSYVILPGREYYHRVLEYYRQRLPHPVFVVCSDDLAHIQRAFRDQRDVVFCGNNTAIDDFAILSSCNHSIMTVGTFGFWSSFLTGGQALFAVLKNSIALQAIDPLEMQEAFPNFIPVFY